MKPLASILLLAVAVSPAFAATAPELKKITVEELKTLLSTDHSANKSDEETANDLKAIELSERLSPSVKESLDALVPGQLSNEQIYVLEARSAMLPPPPADIPSTPAPDAAAQQALLTKAATYVSQYYAHLPALTAARTTARFQDGADNPHPPQGGMKTANESANGNPLWQQVGLHVRLMKLQKDTVETDNGVEKAANTKEKMPWGSNGLIASVGAPLPLATILQEAETSGSPRFLRWESVNGKTAAVFAFSVDKKKTHYAINYCCFPDTDAGRIDYGMSKGAPVADSGKDQLSAGPDWKPFKTTAGYHGELYLDPESGAVVRTLTEAEFKNSDLVRYEDIRTDYGRVAVGDKSLVVPLRIFTNAAVVANGELNSSKTSLRHTFVTQTFKDYQLAGSTAQK
jgi:hypothetical protein